MLLHSSDANCPPTRPRRRAGGSIAAIHPRPSLAASMASPISSDGQRTVALRARPTIRSCVGLVQVTLSSSIARARHDPINLCRLEQALDNAAADRTRPDFMICKKEEPGKSGYGN